MHPFLLVFYVVMAIIVAILGRNRRMGPWGYFFGSLLLTPIIGLLLVLGSGPGRSREE